LRVTVPLSPVLRIILRSIYFMPPSYITIVTLMISRNVHRANFH